MSVKPDNVWYNCTLGSHLALLSQATHIKITRVRNYHYHCIDKEEWAKRGVLVVVAVVALEGIIVELLRGQDLEAAYLLGFKSQPNILLARWPWANHSTFLFLSFFCL